MLWDITAVIGYIFLCGFAFVGVMFTIRAWVFATQLAVEQYKHNKVKGATSEMALKVILTQAEKDALEELQKEQKKNK